MIIREERIGGQRLILGDCREIIGSLSFDAICTDPPYFGREDLFPTDAVDAAMGLLGQFNGFVFWPWYGPAPAPHYNAVHIWHKAVPIHPKSTTGNVAGHHYERIFSFGFGSRSEVFREAAIMPNFAACADEFAKHPTQKPISLVSDLIKRTKNGTILDPFMGSGTTLVACAKLGRRGIGIELDPDYFLTACKRVDEATRQPDLFVSTPTPATQEAMDL